jgi:transposase
MDRIKYIGLDVHQSTTSVAVLDADGKLVMQSVVATHAAAILDFLHGLRGTLHVTFEEGTHSAWLYDLLVRRVTKVVVCNPRKNALLKAGNKSDTIDARKLAELLRAGLLSPVYHGQNSTSAVKHLGRSYAALTEDTTRIMGRLKALYRSQAIACAGKKPYGSRHREEWLAQLTESGLQRRARRLYQQLDLLQELRRQARRDLILECRKYQESKLLRTIPWLGPIRTALLIGRVQTPHRFRSKRQFWAYCGLALETRSSADYQMVNGQLQRRKKPVFIRGLNLNHNHDLKNLFKSAATSASGSNGPFRPFYENLLGKGMKAEMARLTLARKIAAITLHVWKKGEPFDPEYLKPQAA